MVNLKSSHFILLYLLKCMFITSNGNYLYSHTTTLSQLEAFKIYGFSRGDLAGISVSYAGDVNNDGFTDVIVGAFHAHNHAGAAYIVYGNFAMININVTEMSMSQGVAIDGFPTEGNGGQIARYAGDVNGDGYSDVIVTAPTSIMSAGSVYIIFGGSNLQHTRVQSMGVSHGISVTGFQPGSLGGDSASYAGDVNGDGFSDVIIGDYYYSTKFQNRTGGAYIIFGSRSLVNINLGDLKPTQGIWIHGFEENSYAGSTVRYVGDVNDDGFDDILIGTVIQSEATAEAYVFFGQKNLTSLNISATFSSNEGFTVTGFPNSAAGITASYAGDVNGDGIADVIMGAFNADGTNGQAFIVFGNKTIANINVRNMTRTQGMCIFGFPHNSLGGRSVSWAGDLNKDGFDDVVVSAPNTDSSSGSIYIIYGHKSISNINVGNMTWNQGSIINGFPIGSQTGLSVSNAGDVNRDGINEIIVGAPYANSNAGEAFIISAPFQTRSPTSNPTTRPTLVPTLVPTKPTIIPTLGPTNPSCLPSVFPSIIPSSQQTTLPSTSPSAIPTSSSPTKGPILSPTVNPSLQPSFYPSIIPLHSQTNSMTPSKLPIQILPDIPTFHPSFTPSHLSTSTSKFPIVSPTISVFVSLSPLLSNKPSINSTNAYPFRPTIHPTKLIMSPGTGFPAHSSLEPSLASITFPSGIPSQSPPSPAPSQISLFNVTKVPNLVPSNTHTPSPSATLLISSLIPTFKPAVNSITKTICPADGRTVRPSAFPSRTIPQSMMPHVLSSSNPSRDPAGSVMSLIPTLSTSLPRSATMSFQPIIVTNTIAPTNIKLNLSQPNLIPSVQPQLQQSNSTNTAFSSQQVSGINILYLIIAVVVLSCCLCLLAGFFYWKSRLAKSKRDENEVSFDHTGSNGTTNGSNNKRSLGDSVQYWSLFDRRAEAKVNSYNDTEFEHNRRDGDVSGSNHRQANRKSGSKMDWSSLIFGRNIESSAQGQENTSFEHRGNDETINGSNEHNHYLRSGKESTWTSKYFSRQVRSQESIQAQDNTYFAYGGYDSNTNGSAQLPRNAFTSGTKTWANFFLRKRRQTHDFDEEEEDYEEFGYDGYGNKVPINGLNMRNGNRKRSEAGEGILGTNNISRRRRDSNANEGGHTDVDAVVDYDGYEGDCVVDGTNSNRQSTKNSELDPACGKNSWSSSLYRGNHHAVIHDVDDGEGYDHGSIVDGSNNNRLQNKTFDGDDTTGVNIWTSFLFRNQKKFQNEKVEVKETDVDYSSYSGDDKFNSQYNRQRKKTSEQIDETSGTNSWIHFLFQRHPRYELKDKDDDYDKGGLNYDEYFDKGDLDGTNKIKFRKQKAGQNEDHNSGLKLNSSHGKPTKGGFETDDLSYEGFSDCNNLTGENSQHRKIKNVNETFDSELSEINQHGSSLRRLKNRNESDDGEKYDSKVSIGYDGYGTEDSFHGSNNRRQNKKRTYDDNDGNECGGTYTARYAKNNQNISEQAGDWTILVIIESILINFGLVSSKFAFYPKKIVDKDFALNDIYDSDKFDSIVNPSMDQRDVEGSGRLSDFTKELLKLNEESQDQNIANRQSLLSTDRPSSSTKPDDFGVSISYDVFLGSNGMASYDNPLSHNTTVVQEESELDPNVNHYREELKKIQVEPTHTARSCIYNSPERIDDIDQIDLLRRQGYEYEFETKDEAPFSTNMSLVSVLDSENANNNLL